MTPLLLAFGLICLDEIDDFYEPPLAEIGPAPTCDSDVDCGNSTQPYCDPQYERCVECLEDVHCGEGWACDFGNCYDDCTVDAECDGVNGFDVCDVEEGRCADCLSDEDCEAGEYCFEQFCSDDHCTPGELSCSTGNVILCHANGGTFDVVEECPDRGCVDDGDGPYCPEASTTGEGGGEPTGSDTGGMPGGGGGSSEGGTQPNATSGGNPDDGGAGGVTDRGGCSCRSGAGAGWLGAGWMLLVLGVTRRSRS